MARIFNIYFEYQGVVYHAIVSMRATQFFTEYTLNIAEERIRKLLPGNKIISTPSGGFFFQGTTSLENTVLMKSILKAVAAHIQETAV